MTTPKAILIGLAFIAVAIASIPYSNNVVTPALASGHIQKVAICNEWGTDCISVAPKDNGVNYLATFGWND
jgi:hypothetical protein|tara:strand:- start:302 stop:514 length:213 start_codon:yes stop_codon:yes gene_type:complete